MTDSKPKSIADRDLHKSLQDTFPASDPVSSNEPETEPSRPEHRKPAHIDPGLVHDLARQTEEKLDKARSTAQPRRRGRTTK